MWDENKLVEAIAGEHNIFKRRADDPNKSGFNDPNRKKKLKFVLDVSASMYRFNGMDRRLNRVIETAVMIMEAFKGFEDKIHYEIVGHSGDEFHIPLVNSNKPPKNKAERWKVIMQM
eukprot:TRINITY_DN27508_c0_g1_i1.p1 TRINITY_DN27508_c0_g1~~TRINITY_DN27508_c0_g1_i1.p1  ORF type:complete len:135 (+),score=19.96 TRINITY_DN27508_c0_g1_i1:57-407(+)